MKTKLPENPPPSRYADGSRYGFFLEWPQDDPEGRFKASIADIAKSNDYIELVLNPQSVSFDEPYATAITLSQGGGKIVESRGQLLRPGSISGTTGFLPIKAMGGASSGRLVDFTSSAEEDRAQRSGFKAFHDLRRLFRIYGDEHKRGNQVRMHYMDFKEDDFWLITPSTFSLRRTAPQDSFIYRYDIKFTGLEPSGANLRPVQGVSGFTLSGAAGFVLSGGLANTNPADLVSRVSIRSAIQRFSEVVQNLRGATTFLPSAIRAAGDEAVRTLGDLVRAYTAAAGLANESARLWSASREAAYDAWSSFCDTAAIYASWEELADGVLFEWNEYAIDTLLYLAHLRVYDTQHREGAAGYASDVLATAEIRTSGSSYDLVPETGTPLTSNPFVGEQSVFSDPGRTLSATAFRTVIVMRGDTIYDVAKRTMGSIHNFVDLIAINGLNAPYIVENRDNKPPNTVAWGEYLRVPVVGVQDGSVASPRGLTPSFVGSVTTPGTTLQVVDESKERPWREDQWVGYTVTLTSGSGIVDAVRYVVANDADILTLNRAWTVSPTIGDTYAIMLQEFTLRIAPTDEQLVYGRDALLSFNRRDGRQSYFSANAMWNSRGDIATLAGMENYQQAVTLCLGTPRGLNKFHPTYGVGVPIGEAGTIEILPLYTFFARQSLLEDPRTESVKNPRLFFTRGVLEFEADIRPVNAHRASSIRVGL